MPALPAAPGCVQIKFKGSRTATAVWLSRLYIHYTGTAPTAAQLSSYLTALATNFGTNIIPLIQAATALTELDATDLSSAVGATATLASAQTGTRAGSSLPGQACTVVSYEIARRYRGGHPRGYWPFGADNDITSEQTWGTTFTSAVATGFQNMITSMLGAGWTGAGTLTHVNVSYFSGFTVVTNPITHRARNVPTLRVSPTVDTISAYVVRPSIGTQRRRIAFVA